MLECGRRNVYSTETPRVKSERQAFLFKLSYGAVKDLVPTPGNKEWQPISTEKPRFFRQAP